ncbi:hypothetical protein [Priestia megaterium]|uniref:hypothetical protein n=1 Tax=Priestia megaterium TaxID=1404 RepID=UPI00287801F1|nr:hypothetical protein [Priestia megaterium]
MGKVKVSKELGLAMDVLKDLIGLDEMYKFENVLSHYKKSTKYSGRHQEAINTIVNFVKASKGNRITYYNALQHGYERELSPEEKVLNYYEGINREMTASMGNLHLYAKSMSQLNAVTKVLNLLGIEIKGINKK